MTPLVCNCFIRFKKSSVEGFTSEEFTWAIVLRGMGPVFGVRCGGFRENISGTAFGRNLSTISKPPSAEGLKDEAAGDGMAFTPAEPIPVTAIANAPARAPIGKFIF